MTCVNDLDTLASMNEHIPPDSRPGETPVATLTRVTRDGVAWWTDSALASAGVVVAFSERIGGVSSGPYASLNLASHVGDDPDHVDENRDRFVWALGLGCHRDRLVTAEQVHGTAIRRVRPPDAGRGAFADGRTPPIEATDALLTCDAEIPLLLMYADCVPVVLVAPGPCVAVAHAGWRGALAGIVGDSVRAIAAAARCRPSALRAYVGAHIGPCHYDVDEGIMSQFVNTFGTVARAESGGLDLGSVVAASLTTAGVDPCSIASLGLCTAETTDRFYSYRAQAGLTGRHGALAFVTSRASSSPLPRCSQ